VAGGATPRVAHFRFAANSVRSAAFLLAWLDCQSGSIVWHMTQHVKWLAKSGLHDSSCPALRCLALAASALPWRHCLDGSDASDGSDLKAGPRLGGACSLRLTVARGGALAEPDRQCRFEQNQQVLKNQAG